MRCPYCGDDNPSTSKVCETCGRPLPQANRPAQNRPDSHQSVQGRPAQRPAQSRPGSRPAGRPGSSTVRKKKKTRWNPKFLAACAGILFILILIPILIAVAVHHGDSIESRHIQMFYSGHSGKTSIVLNGKVYEKTISGKVEKTASSRDGLIQAALSDTGELFYVTTQKMDSVATGVQSFVLSADGTKLAYVMLNPAETSDTTETSTEEETTASKRTQKKQTDEETTESTTEYVPAGADAYLELADTSLFLYNGTDGTSALVANHVPADSVSLSAAGLCTAYTVTADDGESFEGFYYREGVAVSIGRFALPIAVSDDALHVCYVKYDKMDEVWIQKLFLRNGENEIKLDEFADGNMLSVYLNADYSQIIYSITGKAGAYFFCGPDGEKSKISKGYTPIYPYGQREVVSGKAILTPYATFAKTVFMNASGVAQYMDGKCVSIDLGASGTTFRVSPDGKTIYYLDKDEYLYSCAVRKIDKKDIASHVMAFELSADGEYLYYVNSDNELHCVKGNKNTLLAENVYTSKTVALAATDSGHLYFLQDYAYGSGTLCYVKGDGAVHVLNEINNVHDLASDVGEYIYYRSDFGAITGTYDLYYGKGKKYTKLFEKMG